ncbi:hypothetical protein L798_12937 [Zootermopsis nevadensis]|uniref:Uncharacterized protein n=1 Tax=Zootermopsis nevadensis TaxID=136037 RepID=A0A067QTR1_ZOONE|nr:hypothetical protein L798_12937 [Zootermopsis nevadensis]
MAAGRFALLSDVCLHHRDKQRNYRTESKYNRDLWRDLDVDGRIMSGGIYGR